MAEVRPRPDDSATKTEEPSEPARTSISPALGLSSAPPEIPVEKNDATYYQHCKEVRGRLVFANPVLSDMPLWNAAQVRGNIVVMLRGPKRSMDDKIPPITLLDKITYAQQVWSAARAAPAHTTVVVCAARRA